MILSIPTRRVTIRRSDGSSFETYELVHGFVRGTSESAADHDVQSGGHILLSNPFAEWAMDMVNRGILGTYEKVYIHLHTQDPVNVPGDGLGVTDNDVKI